MSEDALARARRLEAEGDADGAAAAFVGAGAHMEAARVLSMQLRPLDAALALLSGIELVSAEAPPEAKERMKVAASLLREGGREEHARLVLAALAGGTPFPAAVLKSTASAEAPRASAAPAAVRATGPGSARPAVDGARPASPFISRPAPRPILESYGPPAGHGAEGQRRADPRSEPAPGPGSTLAPPSARRGTPSESGSAARGGPLESRPSAAARPLTESRAGAPRVVEREDSIPAAETGRAGAARAALAMAPTLAGVPAAPSARERDATSAPDARASQPHLAPPPELGHAGRRSGGETPPSADAHVSRPRKTPPDESPSHAAPSADGDAARPRRTPPDHAHALGTADADGDAARAPSEGEPRLGRGARTPPPMRMDAPPSRPRRPAADDAPASTPEPESDRPRARRAAPDDGAPAPRPEPEGDRPHARRAAPDDGEEKKDDRYRAEGGWRVADAATTERAIQQFLEAGRKGAAARVAWEAGQHARALEWFLELGLKYQAGACLRALGRPEEALTTLLEVAPDDSRYRRACFDVVALARELGRLDFEVDRFLSAFVAEGPKEVVECGAYLDLAEHYAAAGFAEGARRCGEGVLRLVPGDTRAKAFASASAARRARGSEHPPRSQDADALLALPSIEEFTALVKKHAPKAGTARR